MDVGKSLIRLRESMKISKEHGWNTYFSMPDIGVYPNLLPLAVITWAGHLAKRLRRG